MTPSLLAGIVVERYGAFIPSTGGVPFTPYIYTGALTAPTPSPLPQELAFLQVREPMKLERWGWVVDGGWGGVGKGGALNRNFEI